MCSVLHLIRHFLHFSARIILVTDFITLSRPQIWDILLMVNRYSLHSRLHKMGGARIKPARALELHWQYDDRSPWQVRFAVSTYFTLTESEQNHDDHTVSLLVYSYTLCGTKTKYRYAHSNVWLTSPTHLREHFKGHIHSVATIMTANTSGCLKANDDLSLRKANVALLCRWCWCVGQLNHR